MLMRARRQNKNDAAGDVDPCCYAVYNMDRELFIARYVHIAATSRERRKGLLGVDRLAEGAGLWIGPCEAVHTFGMKIPIDILFLDRERRVRKLVSNLAPARISLCLIGSSVLELASGVIASTGTQLGDQLKFESISERHERRGADESEPALTCPRL